MAMTTSPYEAAAEVYRACVEAALGTDGNPARVAHGWIDLGDLARSTAFLWAEAGLSVQARLDRIVRTAWGVLPTGAGWSPRVLLLTTVAADIYLGYLTLRERARRWPELVRPSDWKRQHERGAARTLDTARSLGGMLIKACQFASVRPDLLPAAYVEALATLQDRVPPRPWTQIRSAIDRELGDRAGAFALIEPEPVAAASLAQVHRARLADGRQVAVKVQYPEVAGLVAADLVTLDGIVASIARVEPSIRLRPILDHLRATLPLELDFRHEARAMTDLRTALAHRDDVIIPAVVEELSTERLLVTEFVDGTKVTDRAALERADIDPLEVACLLNDVYAEQILRLGRLHADPHPGNLLVQPGPRLVLVDHGLTVELSPPLAEALRGMVRALAAGDFDALATALAGVGLPLGGQADIATLLQLAGVLTGGEPPEGAVEAGRRLGASVGDLPPELITVGRALSLLDGITRTLDPDLDTLEVVARYA